MQTYLKTKPVWLQLSLFLGMSFGLFLIASFAGIYILSAITGIDVAALQHYAAWDLTNPKFLTFMRGMILIQFVFLFCIPSILFARFSDPQPLHYLGLQRPSKSIYWVLGLLVIIVAYPFVEYTAFVNQKIALGEATQKWMKGMEEEAARQIRFMLKEHTVPELLKNLLFISLFAGIGEELFFRGVLQRMAIRVTKNPWMGIIITAAIFSGIHFQFYGFFPRMFLGVLLGAVYWYSGSLWVSILAHFLYDAAVILLLYFQPQLLNSPEATVIPGSGMGLLVMGMASLAVTFVILRQMEKQSITRYEAVYNDDFPKQEPTDKFSF